MTRETYFLDTNVVVTAFLVAASPDAKLLGHGTEGKARLVVNQYVLKEARLVLVRRLGVPAQKVERYVLEALLPYLLILKGPSREEVRRATLRVRDRSDLPILLPCVKHGFTLVSGDARLRREPARYVTTRSPTEVLQGLSRE